MAKSCYLAGPMRGYPRFNFAAFDEASVVLRGGGWTVYSPAENDRASGFDENRESLDGFDLRAAFSWDLDRVREVDAVVVLPGWKRSQGAQCEVAVARMIGTPVLEYPSLREIEVYHPLPPVSLFSGEQRVTDPTTGAQKVSKLGRFDLLPWDVLTELAEHFGRGSQKYEDRNWQKGYAWSLSIAALGRHLASWLSGEDNDPETQSSHLIAVAWHALALRWFQKHSRGTDDRWRGAR